MFDLATANFIARREDALFLGPPGTGKSHLAQAIGQAAIQQGYRVLYRETHTLLDELADATIDGRRKDFMDWLLAWPFLMIDDLGMRKLPLTAAEDLLEIIMRRYERASTLVTSNRPVEDWGKLLGDAAAVSAMLDRLLHHGHILSLVPAVGAQKRSCQPQRWLLGLDEQKARIRSERNTIRRLRKTRLKKNMAQVFWHNPAKVILLTTGYGNCRAVETVENRTACFPPFPPRLESSAKYGRVFHSSHSLYCWISCGKKRTTPREGLIKMDWTRCRQKRKNL